MKINETMLRSKGWTDEEIETTRNLLLKSNKVQDTTWWVRFLGQMKYWMLFIVLLAGAIIGAGLIKPFLIVTNEAGALVIVCIIGLFYGNLASIIIRDIEDIQTHHHVLLSFCVPVVAIITSIIISKQAAIVATLINTGVEHNPFLLGITFTISSFIPYSIFLILQRREKHESQ